ncbi:MAG: cytochrome c [Cytophagales bacterium]|nr:cytochrome c [Cytophagales bacterium]
MLNLHKNHRGLVITSLLVFVALSSLIAILPAYQMQAIQPLPTMHPLTEQELNGLKIYTEENCMACHTQQVRNIEMDNIWGERPSVPSDFYYSKKRLDFWRQSPSLLGSERTGPDLTNIGNRQPGKEWHLIHLYNPRIVVEESVMPGYPWLFNEKEERDISETDVVVNVPEGVLRDKSKRLVASKKAIELVAYLQSLKQPPLNEIDVNFIQSQKKEKQTPGMQADLPDGTTLYMNTCSACHQANGKGLPGAFPPLAGSKIVNDNNPEQLIRIILQGYDARAEYAVMIGFADQLTDEEIAAIANHERSSWGNNAAAITADNVKKIREYIQTVNQ